jgi:hypothetical protein
MTNKKEVTNLISGEKNEVQLEVFQAYEDGKTVLAREISEKIKFLSKTETPVESILQEILNLTKTSRERECPSNSPFC